MEEERKKKGRKLTELDIDRICLLLLFEEFVKCQNPKLPDMEIVRIS